MAIILSSSFLRKMYKIGPRAKKENKEEKEAIFLYYLQ
jgi:hypothetical protein